MDKTAALPGAMSTSLPLPTQVKVGAANESSATDTWLAKVNVTLQFKPAPPNIVDLLSQHPELLAWAAGSIIGSLHFTQPGE